MLQVFSLLPSEEVFATRVKLVPAVTKDNPIKKLGVVSKVSPHRTLLQHAWVVCALPGWCTHLIIMRQVGSVIHERLNTISVVAVLNHTLVYLYCSYLYIYTVHIYTSIPLTFTCLYSWHTRLHLLQELGGVLAVGHCGCRNPGPLCWEPRAIQGSPFKAWSRSVYGHTKCSKVLPL